MGKKLICPFIDVPQYDNQLVAFIPIQPVITNFIRPIDIIAGYDELLYVVDEGTNEIVSMDQSGKILSRFYLKGVKKVVQDRKLHLLAIADFDTTINSVTYTLSAIYRIQMEASNYSLNSAKIINKIIHPFYFRTSFAAIDAEVKLNGIALLADGSYYVTRTGPNNSVTRFGGPDDAVIYFNHKDEYQYYLVVNTETGVSSDYFKKPFAIVSLAQPPQSPFVSSSKNFYFTSLEANTALKVQLIQATSTEEGTDYSLNTNQIIGDTSKAEGFLYTANRFQAPKGLAYAGDGTNYLFVTDSEKDSVYVFTNTGLEGVKPPAGAEIPKFIKVFFRRNRLCP
ncbi:MAG: hypothetical protein KatS3mg035_0890 [Bacteroidia bacterium]|nr:MAG: hypothetical protein KatS3mg035_0890 [Bacteroidia bacterium]